MMRVFFTLLSLACAVGPANGQIIYEFFDATLNVPITSLQGTVGTPVTVNVIIRDTTVGSTIFNSNGGLGSAGFRLRYDNPSGIANTSSILHFTNGANGGPWDFNATPTILTNFANVLVGKNPNVGGVFADANGRVRIAQVSLMPLAVGSTSLLLQDRPDSNGDTTSYENFLNYDSLIAPTVLTFTVVPEPFSILAVATFGGFTIRRFRRR